MIKTAYQLLIFSSLIALLTLSISCGAIPDDTQGLALSLTNKAATINTSSISSCEDLSSSTSPLPRSVPAASLILKNFTVGLSDTSESATYTIDKYEVVLQGVGSDRVDVTCSLVGTYNLTNIDISGTTVSQPDCNGNNEIRCGGITIPAADANRADSGKGILRVKATKVTTNGDEQQASTVQAETEFEWFYNP